MPLAGNGNHWQAVVNRIMAILAEVFTIFLTASRKFPGYFLTIP
jgi:hypothetical protein